MTVRVRTMKKTLLIAVAIGFCFGCFGPDLWAQQKSAKKEASIAKPKEFGVYINTAKGLKRLLPNIVFEEENLLFIESNNPARFPLKDVSYFVIYGDYDMQFLTVNPLLFAQESPVGKSRFVFGKDVDMTVTKKGDKFYYVKPKGLLGRGYYCLWINDTAWDFVVE